MLAAHLFFHYLQAVTGWQEARHEAPIQRLRDVQSVTVTGHEWSNPLPNPRKQEPYDFIPSCFDGAVVDREKSQLPKQTWRIALCTIQRLQVLQQWAPDKLQIISGWSLCCRQWQDKSAAKKKFTCSHSKRLGNEMADGLAFPGSQGTCFCPHWMNDAPKKVHRKATEIGTVEPKQEFTLMQHSGWTGFRDVPTTAAEKVIGRGRQLVVGLPYSEESLREIRRKRRLLDGKIQWAPGS